MQIILKLHCIREKSSISFLTFLKEIFISDKNDFILILILDYITMYRHLSEVKMNQKFMLQKKPFIETYNVAQSR